MPLVFTRDQIRSYLQDQGYSLNEDELNAFIHDLRRVIKHEDHKRRRKRLGHDSEDTRFETTAETTSPDEGEYYLFEDEEEDEGVHSSSDSPEQNEEISVEHSAQSGEEIFIQSVKLLSKPLKPGVHSSPKESEHVERSPPKQSLGGSKHDQQGRTSSKNSFIMMNRRTMIVDDNKEPVVIDTKVPIRVDVPDKAKEKRTKTKRPQFPLTNSSNIVPKCVDIIGPSKRTSVSSNQNQKENIITAAANSLRKSSSPNTTTEELILLLEHIIPETGDIDFDAESVKKRPIGPPEKIKRDPVALYHYYKSIWDKQGVPGQNRHMKLRWNVRAQTVGNYPCINGQPIKYLRQ